jgi:hypothetical protein
VDRIETEVSQYICTQFEGEQACQELARRFASFSPILFRVKIRTAVREYQAMVLNFLKNKVLTLETDALPEAKITGMFSLSSSFFFSFFFFLFFSFCFSLFFFAILLFSCYSCFFLSLISRPGLIRYLQKRMQELGRLKQEIVDVFGPQWVCFPILLFSLVSFIFRSY